MSTNYTINLTDNALKKIHSLAEQEGDKSSVLQFQVVDVLASNTNFLMDQMNENPSLDDKDDEESEDYSSHSSSSEKGKDIVINDENGSPVIMVDNCSAKFFKIERSRTCKADTFATKGSPLQKD